MMKHRILSAVTAMAMALSASAITHFGWGAEVGSSIDVSGHDMSTLNIDAFFGYRTPGLDLLGVGAGIHMMVANSCRSFPVYGVVRASFRTKPSLCFLDVRAGVAFNSLSNNQNQSVPYVNPAVGFNLARGKSFQSYLLVGYVYNGMKSFADTEITSGLSCVNIALGITF